MSVLTVPRNRDEANRARESALRATQAHAVERTDDSDNVHDAEIKELIGRITKAVLRATSRGVQQLEIRCDGEFLLLLGFCRTFYTKQVAQEAAMALAEKKKLLNRIRVV